MCFNDSQEATSLVRRGGSETTDSDEITQRERDAVRRGPTTWSINSHGEDNG